jgi:alanyl-tRNA synthetase
VSKAHSKLAHTAEHAFIGALQKLTGRTLSVRKVEHHDNNNLIVIATTDLDLDILMAAQSEVNSLINQGRNIVIHNFVSLAEARRVIPDLRANEERIGINEHVRVIEIKDHDFAACIMDHAANLGECGLFLVTRINRTGLELEVNFVVADSAKLTSMELARKMMNLCQVTGGNYNTIEKTVKRLRQTHDMYLEKARLMSEQILDNIEPMSSSNSGPRTISGTFVCLLEQQIREFAIRKTAAENNLVIVIANLGVETDSMASIVLARSGSLRNIDCYKIFSEVSTEWGKGGGKPEFVTGVIKREYMDHFVNRIVEKIQTKDVL